MAGRFAWLTESGMRDCNLFWDLDLGSMSNDQIQAEVQDPLELEIWRAYLDKYQGMLHPGPTRIMLKQATKAPA